MCKNEKQFFHLQSRVSWKRGNPKSSKSLDHMSDICLEIHGVGDPHMKRKVNAKHSQVGQLQSRCKFSMRLVTCAAWMVGKKGDTKWSNGPLKWFVVLRCFKRPIKNYPLIIFWILPIFWVSKVTIQNSFLLPHATQESSYSLNSSACW